jgi:hypothetical protein
MLVMGASGLIFGIFGLYTTDLIVNFDSIHRPVMQGICVITLLIYFAWSAVRVWPRPTKHANRSLELLLSLLSRQKTALER